MDTGCDPHQPRQRRRLGQRGGPSQPEETLWVELELGDVFVREVISLWRESFSVQFVFFQLSSVLGTGGLSLFSEACPFSRWR